MVGSPFLLVAEAEWVTELKSVPPPSLLLGLLSRSRMHTPLIIHGAAPSWGRHFANSRVCLKGKLYIILLLSPRTPAQDFKMQVRLPPTAARRSEPLRSPCRTGLRAHALGTAGCALCHARWLFSQHANTAVQLNGTAQVQLYILKLKGKKSSKHFTEQSAALGCHWYPV